MSLRNLIAIALLPCLGCVERRLDGPVDALPSTDGFRVELEKPVEKSLSQRQLEALRRIEHLIRSGFHDRAKVELTRLAHQVEDHEILVTLERLDRYLDGHLAHEWLREASSLTAPTQSEVGRDVELTFHFFNPGSTDLVLCAESDEASAGAERSFLRLRLQEIEFGGLGGETQRVRGEYVALEEDLVCLAGQEGTLTWSLPAFEDTGFAILLVRIEALVYPAAVRFAGREVPLRPWRVGECILRVYPEGWELVERDPLVALRASCATDAEAFDRHALIAASLLDSPERLRPAFALLDQVLEEGSARCRAKARACLTWLRGRPADPSLWKDLPLTDEPIGQDVDGSRLELPEHRRREQ